MLIAVIFMLFLTVYTDCKQAKTTCLNDSLIKQIERLLEELKSTTGHPVEGISGVVGAKYIRWGRTTCNENAKLVYEGFAAGNHGGEGGSGANLLCLPKDPEWKEYSDKVEVWRGRLYGIEYEIYSDIPPLSGLGEKDMPCAVCLTDRRFTVLMIPGKVTCHNGWHKEYSGYLMSQSGTNGRTSSEYICADEKLEAVPGGDTDRNQAVVYLVEAVCGQLKCPPYVNGRELTCVVCSI